MKIYVGTSGWFYSWNEERTLDWYIENSNLNAIELNASFYRFPFPNQVKSWAKKGKSLRWAIKVPRLITHQFKFGSNAYRIYERFLELFKVLDKNIDFYLFQLPPNFSPNALSSLERFLDYTKLKERFALEVRHPAWFKKEYYEWAEAKGITWVSIDAPDFLEKIVKVGNFIYLRFHGKEAWYAHDYTEKELYEIGKKVILTKPKRVYAFFNNDTAMLKNANQFMRILKELCPKKSVS